MLIIILGAMTPVTGLSSSAAAGISVAITVPITAAITALVTVIVLYLCGYKRAKKHSTGPVIPQEYETPVVTTKLEMTNAADGKATSGLEMSSNTAYEQVQYTVPTDSTPTATTTTTTTTNKCRV